MLRLAFDFIITWRETRTRPNAYVIFVSKFIAYDTYLNDLYSKSQTTKTGLKCFFARQSKMHIDAIDKFIGEKYGLSEIEIKFLINYDYQYRNAE